MKHFEGQRVTWCFILLASALTSYIKTVQLKQSNQWAQMEDNATIKSNCTKKRTSEVKATHYNLQTGKFRLVIHVREMVGRAGGWWNWVGLFLSEGSLLGDICWIPCRSVMLDTAGSLSAWAEEKIIGSSNLPVCTPAPRVILCLLSSEAARLREGGPGFGWGCPGVYFCPVRLITARGLCVSCLTCGAGLTVVSNGLATQRCWTGLQMQLTLLCAVIG